MGSNWTVGSTTTTYAYDASGNRTQAGAKTFTYDQRNRLSTQSGGISYVYTPRGTLQRTTSGGVYNTTADAFGRVITRQAPGGTGTYTYTYDALGRAVKPGSIAVPVKPASILRRTNARAVRQPYRSTASQVTLYCLCFDKTLRR